MLSIIKLLGFTLLFLRFSYWVGSSLVIQEKHWERVFLAQLTEALFLFFFLTQFVKTPIFPMQQSSLVQMLGFVMIILGVIGAFIAKYQLGNAWVYSHVYRIVPKQKLVTTGIYKIVRHPIYTCIVVSYVGAEFLASSWLWISMLFLLIPFFLQAQKEERLLQKHFGEKYKKYREATKMLIPYLL